MSSASLEALASDTVQMTPKKAAPSSSTSLNKKGLRIPCVGKLRHPSRLCLQEWFFLLGASCMYSITLGFTLQRIIVVDKNTEDFTFALMLIIHIGFCSYHVVFGLFSHRPYELMAHLAGIMVLVLDCTLNLALTNHNFDDPNEQVIKVVILIVLVLEDGISDLGIGNELLVFWVLIPYALLYFIVGHVTFRLKSPILVIMFLACSWPLPVYIGYIAYDVVAGWSDEIDHMLEIITLFLAFVGFVMRVTVFIGVGWPCLIRCKIWQRDIISPSPSPLKKLNSDSLPSGTTNTPGTNHDRSNSFIELEDMYPAGEDCSPDYSNDYADFL